MIFPTGSVCALTLSMYSVKKSFLVLPTSSGKEVSRVDLKKFFVKSCKDKENGIGKDMYNDTDSDKDNDKEGKVNLKQIFVKSFN